MDQGAYDFAMGTRHKNPYNAKRYEGIVPTVGFIKAWAILSLLRHPVATDMRGSARCRVALAKSQSEPARRSRSKLAISNQGY